MAGSPAFATPATRTLRSAAVPGVEVQPVQLARRSSAQPAQPAGQTVGATFGTSLATLAGAIAGAGLASRQARRRARTKLCAVGAITKENPLKVIIAGGGVGGLIGAKAISKLPNVEVVVLEQANKFARFGGPIQIASNALSVIRDIDEDLFNELMARFTFTGNRKNGLVDALRTEWYCTFDAMKYAAEAFQLPYTGVVDRPDLQEILLECLPEGVVQNAKKVAGYEILPNYSGVKVTCEDGETHEADVLLGGDGIWSATRAQMWGEEKKGSGSGCTYSGYIVFAGETVYQPEDYYEVGYKVYMGPKQYFVTSDVGKGRIQWYAFIGVPERVEIPIEKDPKKAFVKKSFFSWSTQILDLIEATPAACIEDRSLYDRPPSILKSWADGPVALMGDACHPMMPNLGQGGCQAMEDGYVLSQKLGALKERSEIPGALQDYYRTRIIRSAAVQGLSRIASDLLLDNFTFPWKAEEGLSSPHGPGRGDFNYDAVVVNYLRHILPGIFTAQFSFLYSYHPYVWKKEEVEETVKEVVDRHKKDSLSAWERRMSKVEKGELEDEENVPSFFAKVAATA